MMTKEEALIILGIDDPADVLEAFEDVLFQHKQFFLTRTPVVKLWKARYKKLNKINEAYEVFEDVKPKKVSLPIVLSNSKEIKIIVNEYYSLRSTINQQISMASSVTELIQLGDLQLDLVTRYAEFWKLITVSNVLSEVYISKEPDPMDVIRSIDVTYFDEVNNLPDDHLLKIEAKRLQMWCSYS